MHTAYHLPIPCSTSTIFSNVFVTFIGLVVLGVVHALALIPVVLSMMGPQVCLRPPTSQAAISKETTSKADSDKPSF